MEQVGIYCIRNTKNNKVYIGSSNNLQRRLRDHRTELNKGRHINDHLQKSWERYGEDCFEFSILECCQEAKLLQREDYYIQKYDSLNSEKGYNLLSADRAIFSESTRQKLSEAGRRPCSEETKRKISEAKKGIKFTDEHRKKLSEAKTGTHLSQQAREKVSAYQKSRPMTEKRVRQIDEARILANKAWRGAHISEKHRQAIIKAQTGRPMSPETKEKLLQANLNKEVSESTRQKLSLNAKNRKEYERICISCGLKFLSRSPNPNIRCSTCKGSD